MRWGDGDPIDRCWADTELSQCGCDDRAVVLPLGLCAEHDIEIRVVNEAFVSTP